MDLLVRFDSDADLFDTADLVFELEELTGLHVDVVSEGGLPDGPHPQRRGRAAVSRRAVSTRTIRTSDWPLRRCCTCWASRLHGCPMTSSPTSTPQTEPE
ncbi:nucleotidyltransferase family protein [Nocardia sp. NPDC058666]|uniref:nucleotidyltransferase family protein n=1 Tax=Nocardia sp. NPDC058666 TaxID=3346587 RepID=UPI00364BB2D5